MKYVALLRGIGPMNPNMRNQRLREVAAHLGFHKVETVLSSGNIIFETNARDVGALEAQLEQAWSTQLAFRSTTIVRTAQQMQHLVATNPFGDRAETLGESLQVTFVKHEPQVMLEIPYTSATGDFTVVRFEGGAICSVVHLTTGQATDLMRWLERTLGKEITTRTWKTVLRIVGRLRG